MTMWRRAPIVLQMLAVVFMARPASAVDFDQCQAIRQMADRLEEAGVQYMINGDRYCDRTFPEGSSEIRDCATRVLIQIEQRYQIPLMRLHQQWQAAGCPGEP